MTWSSRLFIKGALVWLALGFALGGYLLAAPVLSGSAAPYSFGLVHAHMLFVGFITNMILGVSYWMFPRPKSVPKREWLSATVFGLVNVGLALRVVGEPWRDQWNGGDVAGALIVASAALQVLGGLLFVMQIWPRVRNTRLPLEKA